MKIKASHDLYITPLSPVHMGTGENYESINYVIDGGVLYEFNLFESLTVFLDKDKKQLESILSDQDGTRMLTSIQSFFYRQKKALKTIANRYVQVNSAVEAFYKKRIGKVVQKEKNGNDVINQLDISRVAYNPINFQTYLPGSGLKGAIRTALLNQLNNGRPKTDEKFEVGASRAKDFEADLLDGRFETDPLRLVSISDSYISKQQVLTKILFKVHKYKKQKIIDGKVVEPQGIKAPIECIAPFQHRAFEAQLLLSEKHSKSKDEKVFTESDIATACNQFFLPILKKEIQQLSTLDILDTCWKEQIESIINSDAIKKNQAFLLRVGLHSGAESITIEGVRKIKISAPKTKPEKYGKESTTIWLAGQNDKDRQPFGWMLVEMGKQDSVREAIDPFKSNPTVDDWFSQREQEKMNEKARVDVGKAKQEQKAKLIEQQQQQQQQQAQAEQNKLNNMTELERRIYEIEKSDPNNNPAIALYQAIEDDEWPDTDDIRKVAQRIKQLLEDKKEWMPDFSGTNKNKIKKKKRCIQVLTWIEA